MDAHFLFNFLYFALHLHCTLSNSVEKIINGSDVSIESVPYVLSLMLNGECACSATIINRSWAVTAAHCVTAVSDPLEEIRVCSGSSILCENCIIHYITHYYIHENYNKTLHSYDIAVIKVTPEFTYNSFTKPVDLAPNNAENVFKEWGIVCGWGYYMKFRSKMDKTKFYWLNLPESLLMQQASCLHNKPIVCAKKKLVALKGILKFNGEVNPLLSKNLKCIAIPKIENNLCREDYEDRFLVTSEMICYGYQNGYKDACQGDSGSGLVNKDNILLGITSWGDGCGEMYSPGVYTDAILFRNWIKSKTDTDIKYTPLSKILYKKCYVIIYILYLIFLFL